MRKPGLESGLKLTKDLPLPGEIWCVKGCAVDAQTQVQVLRVGPNVLYLVLEQSRQDVLPIREFRRRFVLCDATPRDIG